MGEDINGNMREECGAGRGNLMGDEEVKQEVDREDKYKRKERRLGKNITGKGRRRRVGNL